jgi:NAD-dependent dihydropyrimidine dehydrogenase PreA subunit
MEFEGTSGSRGSRLEREIVCIDEEKCDGCGECVPSCAEGAIRIIDGKARLIADNLCDGLGACLGDCPQGAITMEMRSSDPYDEVAVEKHLGGASKPTSFAASSPAPSSPPTGCPGSRLLDFSRPPAGPSLAPAPAPFPPPFLAQGGGGGESPGGGAARLPGVLRHWPIQLHLLPPDAPTLEGAELLVCATCVPPSMPDFHARLLNGRAVVLACPKLDDQTGYLEKLTEIFAGAGIRSVTVARMVVPCCGGLLQLVTQARKLAGSAIPIHDVVVGPDGYLASTSEVSL